MPDEDEVPVAEMIAPRTLKDFQRAQANDQVWRNQLRIATTAATTPPSAAVTSAVTTLVGALGGIGTVSTSCQGAGSGPVYISLSLAQVTALVTKLTTGILK